MSTQAAEQNDKMTGADDFDTFGKMAQIDGTAFEVIADVEKYYNDGRTGYIYSFALKDNEKIEASGALIDNKKIGASAAMVKSTTSGAGTTPLVQRKTPNTVTIPQNGNGVKNNISKSGGNEGNVINAPIYINEAVNANNVFIVANKMATAYGNDNLRNYIANQIKNRNLVRIKVRSTQPSECASSSGADYRLNASNTVNIPQNDTGVKNKISKNGDKNARKYNIPAEIQKYVFDDAFYDEFKNESKDKITESLDERENGLQRMTAENKSRDYMIQNKIFKKFAPHFCPHFLR